MKFTLSIAAFCCLTYMASAFSGGPGAVVPRITPPIPRRGAAAPANPVQQGAVMGQAGRGGRDPFTDYMLLNGEIKDAMQYHHLASHMGRGGGGGAGGGGLFGGLSTRDAVLGNMMDLNYLEMMALRNSGMGLGGGPGRGGRRSMWEHALLFS